MAKRKAGADLESISYSESGIGGRKQAQRSGPYSGFPASLPLRGLLESGPWPTLDSFLDWP
jgi:hypothetical protein